MKILVLVPSSEYKNNAGSRIRYGRLAKPLERHGISLAIEDIADVDPRSADCDALLISKCYDARSLLAAEILGRRGALVGVDLFDDYFSQGADSRLARYRLWLSQMLSNGDFAISSTAAMRAVAADYAPELPIHVVNDPAPQFSPSTLSALLDEKLSHARSGGIIRVGWFGVGDNPNFAVGLSDIAAFADAIRRLAATGPKIEMSILTNRRAINAEHLAMIAGLPVSTRVAEWSEDAERELLGDCFACMLPVNAQAFSIAKSLNRAVTALTAGCQVLTAGYPLYAALDELIYRSPDEFLEDFRTGSMRLSGTAVGRLQQILDSTASAAGEAAALNDFIRKLRRRAPASTEPPLYLLHGASSNGAAHKMVQAAGGLSVGSPFCTAPLAFDVIFETRPSRRIAMLVSDKALSRVTSGMRQRAAVFGKRGDRNFWEIDADSMGNEVWNDTSLPFQLAIYRSAMDRISELLESAFGPGRVIVSETSPLPFTSL